VPRTFYSCVKIDGKVVSIHLKRTGTFMQQSSIDSTFYVSLLKKEIAPNTGGLRQLETRQYAGSSQLYTR